jgi:hypothetical protein
MFSLFENAAKNKQLFHPENQGHISKTDKVVKTEIEFDIPIDKSVFLSETPQRFGNNIIILTH